MYSIKQASRKIQNYVSTNTELENLVRELSNTDPWGPSSQQLYDLNSMILHVARSGNFKIVDPPFRVDDLPKAERISDTSKTVFHLFNRINQYSNVTVRYIPFTKLRSYLNNEKAPMFPNYGSNQIYDRIKKNYITQGMEFRIIAKSLTVLEYLLINCFDTNYDIRAEISSYTQYLEDLSKRYVCDQAVDHKMKFHTDSIRSKCQTIISLLSDNSELQQKRLLINKVTSKINAPAILNVPAANLSSTRPGRSWSLRDQYNGVNTLGLSLDENNDQVGIHYNDQDLSEYLQDRIEYNDHHQVYDELPDDDFLRNDKLVFEDDEFGDLQKTQLKDEQITNEMDLLDLSDGDNNIHEAPLSPSSVSKGHFDNLLNLDSSKKYVLDEGIIEHTPKSSSSVLHTPPTAAQKLSLFDDLFKQSKNANSTRNF